MHTTITAVGAARLFLREVWKHHGTLHCDLGSQPSVCSRLHPRALSPHRHKVSNLDRLSPTDRWPNRTC
jgi:hypothetical protein